MDGDLRFSANSQYIVWKIAMLHALPSIAQKRGLRPPAIFHLHILLRQASKLVTLNLPFPGAIYTTSRALTSFVTTSGQVDMVENEASTGSGGKSIQQNIQWAESYIHNSHRTRSRSKDGEDLRL